VKSRPPIIDNSREDEPKAIERNGTNRESGKHLLVKENGTNSDHGKLTSL